MGRARSPSKSLGAPARKVCRRCGLAYEPGTYSAHRYLREHKAAPALKRSKSKTSTLLEQPIPDNLQALLDEHEEGVLYLLCRQGRYDSVVTLAADYYDHSAEIQQDRVLEWNLVELLLDDLNKAGLVVYRMAPTPLGEVMVGIKPTFKGYERIEAKFKIEFRWIHMVGARAMRYDVATHGRDDTTDFRNHGDHAVGVGVIITEDFIDHCTECDHLRKHLAQLREMYGSDKL